MFQAWDSFREAARPAQYRLGDRDAVGQPVTHEAAARDALMAIARWLERGR